jgi:glutamate racemase
MEEIKREADVPVIGVIRPGAVAACSVSRNRRIGVIGTARTVESGAYRAALEELDPAVSVFQKATPLLVPLIEEGWTAHPVMRSVLAEYFRSFEGTSIDTLVLGCTHYPLIRAQIESLVGNLSIVDSAATTAESVRALLEEKGWMNRGDSPGSTRIYLTDYTETFREIGERILGGKGFEPRVVSLSFAQGKVSYG